MKKKSKIKRVDLFLYNIMELLLPLCHTLETNYEYEYGEMGKEKPWNKNLETISNHIPNKSEYWIWKREEILAIDNPSFSTQSWKLLCSCCYIFRNSETYNKLLVIIHPFQYPNKNFSSFYFCFFFFLHKIVSKNKHRLMILCFGLLIFHMIHSISIIISFCE